MSNAQKYVTESLAASGLAVISGQVACTLRPDLWSAGTTAGMELAKLRTDYLLGVGRFTVQLDGLNRPVTVLARSDDRLALRLQWLTGMAVLDIGEVAAAKAPQAMPTQPPARAPAKDPRGDQFADVKTAEPGRSCGDCKRLAATGRCMDSELTGLEWPNRKALRRCPQFVPQWEAMDNRIGAQLWPELVTVSAKAEGAAS